MTRPTFRIAAAACALLAATEGRTLYAQTPGGGAKIEFEAASIRVNPPAAGFHFASGDSVTGGPGTADPAMFRCSKCTLTTLITKAFDLQGYQFPSKASLGDRTFEIAAKVPAGATSQDFEAMLQALLKDRFGLTFHFTEKKMRGYQLVVARNGSKLKESADGPRPPTPAGSGEHNAYGHADGGAHNGLVSFNGTARYRADHQTAADLARLLSDQLGVPVNDQTGLTGKYDIALSWSGDTGHAGNHADGAFGGAGHGDHGGGAPSAPAGAGSLPDNAASGPTLFDALQSQVGLRLVPAEQAVARIFAVDHVEPLPTAN